MNPRVTELADKVADIMPSAVCNLIYESGKRGVEFTEDALEKFVELIVRECVQTLIDNTPVLDEYESLEDWDKGYDRAMKDCVHHIREHFGVEQ